MTRFAHITGWGMSVPSRLVTNDALSQIVDTNDEWIRSHTGIRQRYIATARDSTATLAADAAEKALAVAGLPARQVGLIIIATSLPEHYFPSTACVVQDTIGATNASAFDLLAACSGFIYALAVATQMILGGAVDNALVIGSETMSRFLNWNDRSTCVLFGDGAGAVVLQGNNRPGGVLATALHADGSGGDLLIIPAGGSRLPASQETVEKKQHTIMMKGPEVYRFATRVMAASTREVVEKAGLSMGDIDLIIPHQANQRIIDSAAKTLGLPLDRFIVNVDRYGNTSAASIPIAICETMEAGRIRAGDHVVFVAFGAGLTWASAVVKWVTMGVRKPTRFTWAGRAMARVRSITRRTRRRLEGAILGEKET
jgi:3-oxoacyl-[acyl-carrier-protein] synthase-3